MYKFIWRLPTHHIALTSNACIDYLEKPGNHPSLFVNKEPQLTAGVYTHYTQRQHTNTPVDQLLLCWLSIFLGKSRVNLREGRVLTTRDTCCILFGVANASWLLQHGLALLPLWYMQVSHQGEGEASSRKTVVTFATRWFLHGASLPEVPHTTDVGATNSTENARVVRA